MMIVNWGLCSVKNFETGERFCEGKRGNSLGWKSYDYLIPTQGLGNREDVGSSNARIDPKISFQWKEETSLALAVWMMRDFITPLGMAGVNFKTK